MRIAIENTTARIKHIALGGGRTLTVPPSERKGVGKVFELTEAEAENLERTLKSPLIERWRQKGEVVFKDASGSSSGDEGSGEGGDDPVDAPKGKKGKKGKASKPSQDPDAGDGSSSGDEGSGS